MSEGGGAVQTGRLGNGGCVDTGTVENFKTNYFRKICGKDVERSSEERREKQR